MGISLTHPQRQSRQYAYSDRDIAYLEKNGWVREKPPEQASIPALLQPPVKRPGRPRKP